MQQICSLFFTFIKYVSSPTSLLGMIIALIYKILNVIKYLFVLVSILGILGCFNLVLQKQSNNKVPAKNPALVTTPVVLVPTVSYAERKARFRAFADSLNRSMVLSETDRLYKEARIFLPDTTLRADSYLFGRRMARQDSLDIFFYEFSTNAGNTWFHLVSFLPDGRAVDLIEVEGKSRDANLSISLIDKEIFELEYVDFYLSPEYFSTDRYEAAPDSVKALQATQHTAMQDYIYKKDYGETSHYENYRLDEQGIFQSLSRNPNPSLNRKFPFASTRVLASDEIDRYPTSALHIMLHEIYADYGQIFTNPRDRQYFSRRSWFQPLHDNVDDLLSEVEKINITKIKGRLQTAEK